MPEKINPFHARFTVKTVRFSIAKLIHIWIEIAFCCLWVQNLKIPLKLSSFDSEMDLIFLSFFYVGCCLLFFFSKYFQKMYPSLFTRLINQKTDRVYFVIFELLGTRLGSKQKSEEKSNLVFCFSALFISLNFLTRLS